VDIFTHDLGFVVVVENGEISGYNVLAGGGLGMSHGNTQTFPRVADVVGFVRPQHLEAVAKAVITVHRDFGDRTNRKHARLKYVIEERGLEWFRSEAEQRAGVRFEAARPVQFTSQGDLFGWHQQADGRLFLGLFVENGRILDREGYRLKAGLRRVIELFEPQVRLTPTQNILLVNIKPENRQRIDEVLKEHGVATVHTQSRTRLAAMACPALPTCGLALAESERFSPELLGRIEALLAELGMPDEELVVRMTGCPNGCARPYMAEIAFVGKAPNKYQVYLGGNVASTRLNRLYKESVKGDDLIPELRVVLRRYLEQRGQGERFGDFCARVIWSEKVQAAHE
jgi:sulfite reductase (NADPH) hemoprotein beta-component